jgi:hypothetical protein
MAPLPLLQAPDRAPCRSGRRKAALLYVVLYASSCCTKHFNHYGILIFGRVLGGIATSLLWSAFESWVVAEHMAAGFDPAWLGEIFSKATFLGNGLMAVLSGACLSSSYGPPPSCTPRRCPARQQAAGVLVAAPARSPARMPYAGLLANFLVEDLKLGPVAPFDAAGVVLLLGGAIIIASWGENKGSTKGNAGLVAQFHEAFQAIIQGTRMHSRALCFLTCLAVVGPGLPATRGPLGALGWPQAAAPHLRLPCTLADEQDTTRSIEAACRGIPCMAELPARMPCFDKRRPTSHVACQKACSIPSQPVLLSRRDAIDAFNCTYAACPTAGQKQKHGPFLPAHTYTQCPLSRLIVPGHGP